MTPECCATCHFWKPRAAFGVCSSAASDWHLKRTAATMTACATHDDNPQWTPAAQRFGDARREIVTEAVKARAAVDEKIAEAGRAA